MTFYEDDPELESYCTCDGCLAESVPASAPSSDFAAPPKGLYVGDAKHARMAVAAVTTGFRGNTARSKSEPGVKAKIASAIRKFYSGADQKYYLSWLNSGKKPDSKPVREMATIGLMPFSFADEPTMPTVPTLPGVDETALVNGDPDPMYVTRPIGMVGATSDNGLRYDDALLAELERQITEKRPPARRGHVAEDDRSSAFPPDEGTWIGVLRQGDTLYGKVYIHHGTPLKEMIRTRRAAGGKISTSIWGGADYVANEDGTLRVADLDLESVDFVPVERAALKALGGNFAVTSEMEGSSPMAETHDDAAQDTALFNQLIAKHDAAKIHEALHGSGKAHEVAEMHRSNCAECKMAETKRFRETAPEETYAQLSEATRKHIAECYAKETGQSLTKLAEVTQNVAEMKQTQGQLAEMKQSMAEMGEELKKLRKEKFDGAVEAQVDAEFADWHVTTDKGKETLKTLKDELRFRALAEMAGMTGGHVLGNIEPAFAVAAPAIKPLKEMALAGLAGPAVHTGTAVAGRTDRTPGLVGFDPVTQRFTDDMVREAQRLTGVSSRRATTDGGDK